MKSLIQRVKLLPLYVDVVRRLGLGWVLFRVRYAVEIRFGVHERRSPVRPWPLSAPTTDRPPSVISPETLGPWLREHYTDQQKVELQAHVDDLRARRFDVFGTKVVLDTWHDDPYSGVTYPRGLHWSKVPEFEEADIKRVWEPSRFGWVFDLVRAHHLLPESGAGELFWELFDEWCEQNPPNEGVNWKCGQEASIRLMAITCAVQGMPDTLTDVRAGQLRTLAEVTGARVESNIAYARSQKNNHHASEATGLVTAGHWMGSSLGQMWIDLGLRHMIEVSETLIFPDGGSSQHSLNYHRVFLHDLMWVVLAMAALGTPAPVEIESALERAAKFMAAMVEPISGEAPFFGPDDGARILPLDRVSHRHLAEDALVGLAVAGAAVPATGLAATPTEGTRWVGRDDPLPCNSARLPICAKSFPDMGVHVLAAGPTRVFVRCGTYNFRPHEEDQMHCDIWMTGINVASDAGTGSYKPSEGTTVKGDSVSDHNSVALTSRGHMDRLSRFLWAGWPSGAGQLMIEGDEVHGEFVLVRRGQYSIERQVEVRVDSVFVRDREKRGACLRVGWNISELDSLLSVHGSPGERAVEGEGRVSASYGKSEPVRRVVIESRGPVETIWARSTFQ